jgi:hypothetical protein
LEELASSCEPQQLTEKMIKENLLNKLEIKLYRAGRRHNGENLYTNMLNGNFDYKSGEQGFLWVKAYKI